MNQQDVLETEDEVRRGMQDLVVDTTSVSWVDGINGCLYYRGINISELVAHATFEETAWLLLFGKLPGRSQMEDFCWCLRNMSQPSEKIMRIVRELPPHSPPLLSLQTGLAAMSCIDRGEFDFESENIVERSIKIIAQTPVILTAAYRNYFNMPMLEPRTDLGFVENFLYMLFGKTPSKKHVKCMEIALIIQMDHGFNSSTFTARAVASTLTNMYSAASAAVGALNGPLHGGASEHVIEMLKNAKSYGNPAEYINKLLEAGGKIMGMGHRVYKTSDPRAVIFRDLLVSLTPPDEKNGDLELLTLIEKQALSFFARQMKPVFTNVDFWSGAVYKKLGIHPMLYPAIFAAARIVGWCAHIFELRQNNRLYRPKSHYIGRINLPYVPMDKRKD